MADLFRVGAFHAVRLPLYLALAVRVLLRKASGRG